MTYPRGPIDGEFADVLDIDEEIEALRLGLEASDDLALAALIDLRDEIDLRASALLAGHLADDFALDASEPTAPRTEQRPPAAAPSVKPASAAVIPLQRRWQHHRLAVLPVAGVLVLASTGVAAALSGSPEAPLYPLHRLVFGSVPSADGQIARDLAAANRLLDEAAARPLPSRTELLNSANGVLAAARTLLSAASDDRRGEFAARIQTASDRSTQLAAPPASTPTPAPSSSASAGPTTEDSGSALPSTSAAGPPVAAGGQQTAEDGQAPAGSGFAPAPQAGEGDTNGAPQAPSGPVFQPSEQPESQPPVATPTRGGWDPGSGQPDAPEPSDH